MRAPAKLRSRAKGNREFRDAAAVATGVHMAASGTVGSMPFEQSLFADAMRTGVR